MERLQLCVCAYTIFTHPQMTHVIAVGRMDLFFWYGSAFGSPVARVQGIGYVQELVSRLTHTPISVHNSSTNATLDNNPATFPLGQSLYVDATHEVVVLNGKVFCILFGTTPLTYHSHHRAEPV